MTPKLTLIDTALEEVRHDPRSEPVIRQVLERFAPSIAKQARQQERQAIFASVGAKTMDDLSAMPELKAHWVGQALVAGSQGFSHGFHKAAWIFGLSCFAGGVVSACALLVFIVVPFNEQTRASTEAGVMVGVAATQQSDRPLGTCTPGTTRPDGSVCGEPSGTRLLK